MKTSNANIAVKVDDGGEFTTLVMGFQLHKEDMEIVEKLITPALNKTSGRVNDLADVLLTMITYGIHSTYEALEGIPFTLRMDRKKHKS